MRDAKELLIASKEFACEKRWLSWWYFLSTLGIFGLLIAASVSPLPLVVRIVTSIFAGLVCVRLFIIFHDFQHHAILRNSKIAEGLLWIYGVWTMNPPSVWNRSHGYHHKHNSKIFGSNNGSYAIMTVDTFATATPIEKFAYAAGRHPLTILFGYGTIFFWGMSLRPFIQNPKRHWDGAFAVVAQVVLLSLLWYFFGFQVVFLGSFLPLFIACAMGAYLFYAQHNFPGAQLSARDEWNHVEAALKSSSYTRMGPIMNWFTGNIGYHHVHHLNALIPFYRLPEAMAAMPELQTPGETSLRPADIAACLRLKLWDQHANRFVGFGG